MTKGRKRSGSRLQRPPCRDGDPCCGCGGRAWWRAAAGCGAREQRASRVPATGLRAPVPCGLVCGPFSPPLTVLASSCLPASAVSEGSLELHRWRFPAPGCRAPQGICVCHSWDSGKDRPGDIRAQEPHRLWPPWWLVAGAPRAVAGFETPAPEVSASSLGSSVHTGTSLRPG